MAKKKKDTKEENKVQEIENKEKPREAAATAEAKEEYIYYNFYLEPPFTLGCNCDRKVDIFLSPWFYSWVMATATSIVSPKFIGWVFPLHRKKPIIGALTICGHIGVHSGSEKYILSEKMRKKAIRNMFLAGKIWNYSKDIYPEYAPYNNLSVNCLDAVITDNPIFEGLNDGINYEKCYNNIKTLADKVESLFSEAMDKAMSETLQKNGIEGEI